MAWTHETVLQQINRSDRSVTGSLVRLWERQAFTPSDSDLLCSLAEQVIWRSREIERGERSAEMPLLSARQLEIARLKLAKYVGQLVEIANQRHPEKAPEQHSIPTGADALPCVPACARCGEQSSSSLVPPDASYRDRIALCCLCFPIVLREMSQSEYQLTEDERERARQEIEERAAFSVRRETAALVIEGTNIRFKNAKELLAQHGLPKALDTTSPKARGSVSERVSTADPFSFGGDMCRSHPTGGPVS